MALSYGKWTKYQKMKENGFLHPHLPETALFSEKRLWDFVERFCQVVIKPSLGYGGKGIMQVSQLENDNYEIHHWYKKMVVNSRTEVMDYFTENRSKKMKYIVQQKIPLSLIDHAPFDLRVMVQRKKGFYAWKVTGCMAKVAANGFIITNAAQKVYPGREALKQLHLEESFIENLIEKINEISLITANHLQNYYRKSRRMGLDIGIDSNGKPWIIEVNLTPSIAMFNLLEDKSMLNEIREYRRG